MQGGIASKAVVLGALGQDGTLISESLRRAGYQVIGVDRVANNAREVICLDLRDHAQLGALLSGAAPQLIVHLAAVHGEAGSSYELLWRDMLAINVASVHVALEYLRTENPKGKLIFASSIKVFGDTPPAKISDDTPMRPTCLYGISKQAATEAIKYYRVNHGSGAIALHFGNHESWLRPPQFFIPKLVGILAGAISDSRCARTVHTLDFWCDWGSAPEFMDCAVALAEADALADDCVVARGKCVYARDLAAKLFARFGLDYRNHIQEEEPSNPQSQPYQIECINLRRAIGQVPQVDIEDVCLEILRRKFNVETAS